jgi:hypothetical protein
VPYVESMWRTLALVTLVVLAGCASVTGPDATATTAHGTDAQPGTVTSSPTPTRTATTTASPTPTPTVTTEPPPDNPWRAENVTVVLDRQGHAEIDYESTLRSTLAYWNDNMQFANYSVTFVYADSTDRTNADVVVEIRDSVAACGYEENVNIIGCAPRVRSPLDVDRPVVVGIEAGYTERSTRSTMIHEFGHVLGLGHDVPPRAYMEAQDVAIELEQPDATERAYPWETSNFSVYAATDQLPPGDRTEASDQVGHAVDYYNRIAGDHSGVPDNVTLRRVDSRADANVVVLFPDQLPTGRDDGSVAASYGFDPDGDGALEYYTETNISISGVDTDTIGWHTGYWFGRQLGMAEAELPAPFRDATYANRKSDWWRDEP